jgi:hypothetical protein
LAQVDVSGAEALASVAMEPEAAQSVPARPQQTVTEATLPSAAAADSITYNPHDMLRDLSALPWDESVDRDPEASDLLQRLRLQGAESLVPIRDFLLDGDKSADLPPELRLALLDILLDIGSPEVEDVALQLLATGPAAPEVLELGLYLESVEPGMHSDAILLAAEQALIDADPSKVLPAEFFQLLGALGNAETVPLLAQLPSHHEAYAGIALAAIPDGGGLAPLEQQARRFAAGQDTMQGRLALQLLAQLAPQYPQAASALIELAGQGAIPKDVWPYVLEIVAGDWEWALLEPDAGDRMGSHTFYSPQGNQVIYRTALHQSLFDEDVQNQRIDLFERLESLAP